MEPTFYWREHTYWMLADDMALDVPQWSPPLPAGACPSGPPIPLRPSSRRNGARLYRREHMHRCSSPRSGGSSQWSPPFTGGSTRLVQVIDPGLDLRTAMEPAVYRREHRREFPRRIIVCNQPQWSPPFPGGSTRTGCWLMTWPWTYRNGAHLLSAGVRRAAHLPAECRGRTAMEPRFLSAGVLPSRPAGRGARGHRNGARSLSAGARPVGTYAGMFPVGPRWSPPLIGGSTLQGLVGGQSNVQPQWSPPLSAGAPNGWALIIWALVPPQWSPPFMGGSTKPHSSPPGNTRNAPQWSPPFLSAGARL
jgi:hypothetical protein